MVVDGRGDEVDGDADGFWMGPTLLDKVPTTSSAYTDEIFGPVLSVVRVSGYDEGLELINSGPYGNGSAIFTNDGGAARRFQREVEAGMVGINVPIPVPVAYHSFGGWKASLFGDAKAYGPHGVRLLHPREGRHPALARPLARRPQPGVPAAHLRLVVPPGMELHAPAWSSGAVAVLRRNSTHLRGVSGCRPWCGAGCRRGAVAGPVDDRMRVGVDPARWPGCRSQRSFDPRRPFPRHRGHRGGPGSRDVGRARASAASCTACSWPPTSPTPHGCAPRPR